MSKKQDQFYFDTFISCVKHACRAAEILNSAFCTFDPEALPAVLNDIHAEEHAADNEKHELMNVLAKAFITPIEREDIYTLSQNIDDMVDKIEDVLQRVYCNNITSVREDSRELCSLVAESCNEVLALITEFKNFKHSKHIGEHIVKINTLEEKGDAAYLACLRRLHTEESDPLTVFAWHELYGSFEKCMDACEHVADAVESTIMKNS